MKTTRDETERNKEWSECQDYQEYQEPLDSDRPQVR